MFSKNPTVSSHLHSTEFCSDQLAELKEAQEEVVYQLNEILYHTNKQAYHKQEYEAALQRYESLKEDMTDV